MTPIDKLVRVNILSLQPYSSARDEHSGLLGTYLDANESPFGKFNRYPDPLQKKLKRDISKIKGVPTDNIFIGNGSDEIIDLCFRLFCEPGKDSALTFIPTYGMYKVAAEINDVALHQIPLNDEFQIDRNRSMEYLTRENLKLIFICSPNNPTGNRIADIEFILDSFSGIVVVDEAYIDFSGAESYSKRLQKYPNLIVLQTLSKAWGKAAVRVGMAFTSAEIIKYLNRIKPPYNVSTPNQIAARTALQKVTLFQKQLKTTIEQRGIVAAKLKRVPWILVVYPSESNFILIKVANPDKLYEMLVRKKIIIRNRSREIPGCVRVTIGTPEENDLMIKALKQINP
jgi:histidinol-phosphate aminotransferase